MFDWLNSGLGYIIKFCYSLTNNYALALLLFAFLIKVLITAGLVLGIIRFLSGYEVIKGLETIENASLVCLNASVVMTGAFPFMFVVSKILSKPLKTKV